MKGAYPHILVNRRSISAHRFSYEMFYGAVPNDLLVLHKCDNVKCVRPDHLFLGTHQDNICDAYNKKRVLKKPTIKRLHPNAL